MSAKFLLLPLVFTLLLFFSSNVQASFYEFYDWGPWYGSTSLTTSSRVLAEATGPAIPSPQADIRKPNGLLPDSPFYIFKSLGESLPLLLTFDVKARETSRLHQAEERLAETKALLEKEKYPLASKNLERYQKLLESISSDLWRLKQRGLDLEKLAKDVELVSAKHSLVLEKISPVLPESVQYPLEKALKASQKGMDVASDVLGRDPAPFALKERLESLKALGILRPGEVEAIFVLRFRDQVRTEIERLSKRNLVPEADIKRLDEAQNAYFPADYLRVTELKKIQEFKNLEELKPDEATIKKIEEFIAVYKPGEPIPPDLRVWWVPLQRYQELSETIRPDLVVGNILPKENNLVKVDDLIELFKPTQDQIKAVDQWVKDNPGQAPPPEIQRVASLALNLGSQVSWSPPENIRQAINNGFPTTHPPPAGFSGLGTCATEKSCEDLCKKNPFACVGSASEKKEELAKKAGKPLETATRKESPLAHVPERSPIPETQRTTPPSSDFISPNQGLQSQSTSKPAEESADKKSAPSYESFLQPSPSLGYFGSGFATRIEEKTPEGPSTEQPPTTSEASQPSPQAIESASPSEAAAPPPTPEPPPPLSRPVESNPPQEVTTPTPSSSAPPSTTGTTTQSQESRPETSPVTIPPVTAPAITIVPRAPEPFCPQIKTKAKHDFTGEVRDFPTTCLPTNWHPYLGSEKSGEVSRPKSLHFQQLLKRYKRYFNR